MLNNKLMKCFIGLYPGLYRFDPCSDFSKSNDTYKKLKEGMRSVFMEYCRISVIRSLYIRVNAKLGS